VEFVFVRVVKLLEDGYPPPFSESVYTVRQHRVHYFLPNYAANAFLLFVSHACRSIYHWKSTVMLIRCNACPQG
jgi:hypothetical protein